MELKPLDRTTAEYVWALDTWLEAPGLDAREITLIQTMRSGVGKSMEDFDQLRRIALQPSFLPTLQSAVDKARRAGLLRNWDQYAH